MEYDEYDYSNVSYTLTGEDEDYAPSPHWLMCLATAITLLTNVFLLVVLCSAPPRLTTSSNVIFLQRAIADLLSSIALVFFTNTLVGANIMVLGTCITFGVLLHVGEVASIVFLMVFTLDSYMAAYPQDHPPPSRRRTMWLSSTLAWVLAVATGIATIFFTEMMGSICILGPFFNNWRMLGKAIEVAAMFLVPLIVTWALVSVALPPRRNSFPVEETEQGEKGPNRKLMLTLTSVFTVNYSLYWIFEIGVWTGYLGDWAYTLYYVTATLPGFNSAINPILVIYLTEDLRQKVAGWLPSRRHSTSLPLGEL